ncbi:hypothetical protein SN811_08340 [Ligilactobacillus agilis]|uniref:Uncharacterized protein n=1 Tax=Ligilactobacillus agilis TaxID=1601 RepID=A0A6F9Y450_9LACO|nr:hypothetical protein [Ligilactobacillus agilis]GET12334.1 hypothetical protein SN811_08340 [Ligilactobacillus agilis]
MKNLKDFHEALDSLWTDVVLTRKNFNDSYLPLSASDRVKFNDDFRELGAKLELMMIKTEKIKNREWH